MVGSAVMGRGVVLQNIVGLAVVARAVVLKSDVARNAVLQNVVGVTELTGFRDTHRPRHLFLRPEILILVLFFI